LTSANLPESNVQKLNLATIEVANNRDISGGVIAYRTNRGLRTGNGRRLWRIACSTFLWSLMVAGLFFTLAIVPGRADEDKDRHRGREDNDEGIRAEIAALQAQVAALRDQVNTLQTANTNLQNEINSLQASNTALQTQLASVQSNHALLLGPFVSVDPNPKIGVIGPNIIFSGANIHIVSGSGRTDDNGNPTGLGNLIIGYDEDPNLPLTGDSSLGLPTIMQTSGGPSPLSPGDRGGSHNLVIGGGNRFTQAAFGGFVAGERNTIKSFGATVGGGFSNSASGLFASVSGGIRNSASGLFASVSSGGLNNASGTDASVSGGFENGASGAAASVSGGVNNGASGVFTSVSGGFGNLASGDFGASISGGGNNTARGGTSTVSGGNGNTAGGVYTVVIGGSGVTDNNNNSIAPQPPFP
jgi:trimeric autotransporter adhesin